MKTRITRQEARGPVGTLRIGYAEAQSLLRFQNAYGYMPDIVKIIDELGGTIEILKS